jgi:hypothetical protein
MTQTPVTAVPQTWLQQIMPYLVMLCVTVITSLIAVIKVYADKLIVQLQTNKSATDDAAASAKSAATLAATASLQLAAHNENAGKKLDTIIDQTNGINVALTAQVADQKKQIAELTNKPV